MSKGRRKVDSEIAKDTILQARFNKEQVRKIQMTQEATGLGVSDIFRRLLDAAVVPTQKWELMIKPELIDADDWIVN